MNKENNVEREIREITNELVTYGLSSSQNFPVIKDRSDSVKVVEWNNISNLSISLKNISYKDIYDELDRNRDYNIKLLDGSLVQLMYSFKNDEIISHRLSFFPSPYLESYQNEPERYEFDEIYADIINKNIVAFPIRFDFNKEAIFTEYPHPKSHVTLGQYKNCRIPVFGPVSPKAFIEFILRNFYSKAFYNKLDGKLSSYCTYFNTIEKSEQDILHFNIRTA